MKVTEIIHNQCIRVNQAPATPLPTDTVKGLSIVRGFETRYGFLQGPRTLSEFDFNKGVIFLHGQFQRGFIIDKCTIYGSGIIVEAKVRTEELDAFLNDASEWTEKEFGLPKTVIQSRAYLSQVELEANLSLGGAFEKFSGLCKELTELLPTYGQNTGAFQLTALTFFNDTETIATPKAGAGFIFARREKKPFASNLYFSSAPVTSADHERLLTAFEKLF